MSTKISNSLLRNSVWSVIGRFGYLIIVLITNIILARILEPKDFGVVAIVMFFITFSIIISESGLSGALVRKNNVTDLDISTIFLFNLFVSSILIIFIYFSSGLVSRYYDDNSLRNLLNFSLLILLFNSLGNVQMTLLIKDMKFKLKSILEMIAILCGSILSIVLAVNDFGKISIIWMYVVNAFVLTLLMWFCAGPLKNYKFSIISFKEFYKFGFNTTMVSIINTIFNNIYQLIFAKYFSMGVSGHYYQAKQLHDVPVNLLQSSVISVFYSALSKKKDNDQEFNIFYNKALLYYAIAISLVCSIIFLYSDLIIKILLGQKWISVSYYLKLLIIAAFFYCIEVFYKNIFKVFNETGLMLKLELFKKIIQVFTIVIGIYIQSINVFILGFILTNLIGMLITIYYGDLVRNYKNIMVLKILLVFLTLNCFFYFALDFLNNDFLKVLLFPFLILGYIFLLKCFNLFDFIKFLKEFVFSKNKLD